ncbi:hypothetical protein B0H19DRAFT_1258588 [Mycena capillaripes]|nr:hypothetical protein B0H19DRAFT_1258588 [Mycena capillaripes]
MSAVEGLDERPGVVRRKVAVVSWGEKAKTPSLICLPPSAHHHPSRNMHPALKIDNFKRLPPSVRRLAVAACKKNCTAQDVERARIFLNDDDVPESHAIALLPVFFGNLDPAGIPTTGELDVVDSESRVRDIVSRALISTDAIAFMHELPPGTGVPLWHRVWSWTQFMSDSWDHFRDLPYDRSTFYYHFLRIAGQLQDDPQTWDLMSGTSGF